MPVATGLNGPVAIAVDGTNVYWSMRWAPGSKSACVTEVFSQYALMKVPAAGGAPVEISCGSSWSAPAGVAVYGSNIYWGVDLFDVDRTSGLIMTAPTAGGPATVLTPEGPFFPTGIAASAAGIYWANKGACSASVHGQVVCTPGQILEVAASGGDPILLAAGLASATNAGPNSIAVDSASGTIFWSNSENDTITKFVPGSEGPTTIAIGQGGANGLTIDAATGTLFWTNSRAGTVMRAPVDGGAPIVVAELQNGPSGIAVDATGVYWTNSIDGSVMKLRKITVQR